MRRSLRTTLFGGAVIALALTHGGAADAQALKPNRVDIQYVEPKTAEHRPVYELIKQGRMLERVRELLVPLRLPSRLLLKTEGCDGVSNAWYDGESVTVCYEFLDDIWKNAATEGTPAGIAPIDTLIGPAADVFLHEVGHAVFDLWKIPILGREEDAADQFSTYIMLQFRKDEARRLIMGNAYQYKAELKARQAAQSKVDPPAPQSAQPKADPQTPQTGQFKVDVQAAHAGIAFKKFADAHGTPAQRYFNVLCLAYGADSALFADIVIAGYLPEERAVGCEDEYKQVAFALRTLMRPYIDQRLARKLHKSWLPPVDKRPARRPDMPAKAN